MISVIIPTLNAERCWRRRCRRCAAAVDGLVREVIVVDGGSSDATAAIADQAGATFVWRSGGRGYQLMAGARRAPFPGSCSCTPTRSWRPGGSARPPASWKPSSTGKRPPAAAAFRFALDDVGLRPRFLERLVALGCALLRLPYGDQGLLIGKPLYGDVGGYGSHPLMEDVDLVLRLGRRRLTMLRSRAVTSAVRYQRDGYLRRSMRNLFCLILFFLRVPTTVIRRVLWLSRGFSLYHPLLSAGERVRPPARAAAKISGPGA